MPFIPPLIIAKLTFDRYSFVFFIPLRLRLNLRHDVYVFYVASDIYGPKMVQDLSCYDGLRLVELDGSIDDPWLIVAIEALQYCTLNGVKSIQFNRLRLRCDEALNVLTDGKRSNFGGTFGRILKNPRYRKYRKYFHVRKYGTKNKRATFVYPQITAIQDELGRRISDNINTGAKVLSARIPGRDKQVCERQIIEEVPVSDRVDVVVTRGSNVNVNANEFV